MREGHDLPTPFGVSLTPDRERLVVAARGELDLETADEMASVLLEQFDNGFVHVVADLRGLTFIDSSGIRTLWQAHQRAERGGARLSIITGDGHVSRALDLTGLLDLMYRVER